MQLNIPPINLPLFKRNPNGKESIDISEAFSLTSLLSSRYHTRETIHVMRNFIHDRDLFIILEQVLDDLNNQVNLLEEQTVYFQLKVPSRPPYDGKTSQRVNIVRDEYIFRTILNGVTNDLFSLVQAVRNSTTNDRLRTLLRDMLKVQMNNHNLIIKYGKVKEWLDPDPTYKTAKAVKNEKLSIGSAFHVWDHSVLRYDQYQITDFFASFAHDPEYLKILNAGKQHLKKQINKIEKMMLEFEIPLSKRPPITVNAPIDPETLEDIFSYRVLFRGIQEAMDLHLRAIVQSTRNDALRQIYINFLKEEMEIFDHYLKYGKAKGWIVSPPQHNEPI